ncbi:MAG: restriction endonuclease subunit S [Cryomorphaceae bacterium]|nr:restriction endonuclease subunit S [Cryomorphaceae bacterium]
MSKDKLIPELRFPEFNKEWNLEELEQCLDYLQPTPYLVESTDYKDEYDTPVLTAGKSFILGYTNEKEGVFQENLPVIIFDDFTTATQFVDFPFKTKSSAMKILLSKNGNDIKFVYEAIKMINYEVGVHQRHWISIFSKLKIPTPNLQEQQKIASCLSSLDELIAAETQYLATLQDHKKGLMQNLFPKEGETVPKVRFKEFEKDGEWVEKTLIDTADKKVKWSFTGGPFGSNLMASDYKESGFRIIQLQNIGDGVFNDDNKIYASIEKADELLSCNIYAGDIIISKMGDPVGRACIIPDNLHRCIMASDGIRLVVDETKYSKYFIYSLINSKRIREAIDRRATGSTRKRIGLDILREIELIVPKSLKEQQKIASCLSSLDTLITAQAEKIEQLQQHKKGLMQGLFPKIV